MSACSRERSPASAGSGVRRESLARPPGTTTRGEHWSWPLSGTIHRQLCPVQMSRGKTQTRRCRAKLNPGAPVLRRGISSNSPSSLSTPSLQPAAGGTPRFFFFFCRGGGFCATFASSVLCAAAAGSAEMRRSGTSGAGLVASPRLWCSGPAGPTPAGRDGMSPLGDFSSVVPAPERQFPPNYFLKSRS